MSKDVQVNVQKEGNMPHKKISDEKVTKILSLFEKEKEGVGVRMHEHLEDALDFNANLNICPGCGNLNPTIP